MRIELASTWHGHRQAEQAAEQIRRCVHCGFCNATCPTYRVTGDELDGPRGRIYLIKQLLESGGAGSSTRLHLDRCLTCLNCETTCPSGVEYGRIVDAGRAAIEERVPRSARERWRRRALAHALTSRMFGWGLSAARLCKPLLPKRWRAKVMPRSSPGAWPTREHARKVLVLAGCVQPSLAPRIGHAGARVLDALGVQAVRVAGAGCCGALRHHLTLERGALDDMRRTIDAWWPHIERGIEAIVIDASGCGSTIKQYGHRLHADPLYADKAARIAALTLDLAEYLARFESELKACARSFANERVVFHPPCSLQHGQRVTGVVETLLAALGVDVAIPPGAHLCCGSAGSYSLLQPAIANRLRDDKLRAIETRSPAVIVSANIGCIAHLQSGSARPVMHWIEYLDLALRSSSSAVPSSSP